MCRLKWIFFSSSKFIFSWQIDSSPCTCLLFRCDSSSSSSLKMGTSHNWYLGQTQTWWHDEAASLRHFSSFNSACSRFSLHRNSSVTMMSIENPQIVHRMSSTHTHQTTNWAISNAYFQFVSNLFTVDISLVIDFFSSFPLWSRPASRETSTLATFSNPDNVWFDDFFPACHQTSKKMQIN